MQIIADVEMFDYNVAEITERETACFCLKTATKIVNNKFFGLFNIPSFSIQLPKNIS